MNAVTRRQTIILISIFLSNFLHGCKRGWIGSMTTLIDHKSTPFILTKQDISWIMSIPSIGDLFSVIVCCSIGSSIGRKTSIIITIWMHVFIWLILCFVTSANTIIACSFALGAATGIHNIISNIYIGEIASPENRGLFITLNGILNEAGMVFEYLALFFDNYHVLVLSPLIISLLALCSSVVMKESPYYLASKNRMNDAKCNLAWITDTDKLNDEDQKKELEKLIYYVKSEKKETDSLWKLMLLPNNFKILAAVVIIRGLLVVNCDSIISRSGAALVKRLNVIRGEIFVNLFGISRLILRILSLIPMYTCGRRPLIIFGFFAVAIIQLLGALCYFIEEKNNYDVPFLSNIILCLIFVFLIVFNLTVMPAVMTLKSEIFPFNLKEFGISISKAVQSLLMFNATKSFFPMSAHYGVSFCMITYSVSAFFGGLCAYVHIKETKDKTLEEIQQQYK